MPAYQDFATQEILDWLLEGDPAVRWQVQRDLLDAKPAVYEAERAKVATEGWGAQLLEAQLSPGHWSKAPYIPKYTSTHYTMMLLWRLGLPEKHPDALKACLVLLDNGFTAHHGINHALPERPDVFPDICVTGMTLSLCSSFGADDERVTQMAKFLVEQQMDDDGWNCRAHRGDKHASFHTTLSVMEGLHEYQRRYPKNTLGLEPIMSAGREFLLAHHLYKSHRTGKVVKEAMTRMPFPPQWQYDFLKALDHFQYVNAQPDERAQDGIDLLLSKQREDAYWPQDTLATGKMHFTLEMPSQPNRMNTLRALRVLRWWYGD